MHVDGESRAHAASEIGEDQLQLVEQARIERDVFRPHVALIVVRDGFDEEALHSHCSRQLRDVLIPASFVRVDAIPRGTQGKIDRQAVLGIGRARLSSN